jgi:hypothetical protein
VIGVRRLWRAALAVGAVAAFAVGPSATAAVSIVPTVTGGTPGANGWYVSDVTVSIATPGAIDTTCPTVKTFRSSSDTLDCSASDGTPVGATLHLQFNIDKDAPAVTGASPDRPANASGWYNAPVTITLAGSDATSGIASCDKLPYGGPDSASASVTGTCRDNAGNVSAPFSFALKYDATPPGATASPSRGPDSNGWYSHAVSVAFSGTDATSGIGSCTSAGYNGPDTASASVTGTCTDNAGNVSAPASYALKYDATAPSVSASASRGPDSNGWYNHPVSVAFSGTDATSGIDSCTSAGYNGPDTPSTSVTGTCTDKAGNSASGSFSLQYDASGPSVTVTAGRPPDANGWYNHPLSLNVSGNDGVSGIGSCTGGSYSGPASDGTTMTGSCVDKAGNSASNSISFKYDSTPPTVGAVTAAAGNAIVRLHWKLSDNTSITVARQVKGKKSSDKTVYHGTGDSFTDTKLTNGVKYQYTLAALDQAGNAAKKDAVATPLALTVPVQGAKVKKPPKLAWAKVPGASYYNVQIFFKNRKVLSTWPVKTTLKLSRSWKYNGHKHKLARGRYRWYVWPGYGPRKASKYGKLLGGSAFFVVK